MHSPAATPAAQYEPVSADTMTTIPSARIAMGTRAVIPPITNQR